MPGAFEGRTVVITGAGGGQGQHAAIMFAREGANVAFCDVIELEETLQRIGHECSNVLPYRADLSDIENIRSFVDATLDRFQSIDIVYNNAGVNFVSPISDTTEEDWDRVHAINVKAAFFLVKFALTALRNSSSASVINISSGAGLLAPADGNAVYCSSKGALIALTRAQARDLAKDGIRVNCLLPGPVETPMIQRFFDSFPADQRQAAYEASVSRSMLKRFGQPEEIVSIAMFLASPAASYLTGAIIPVDGGWTST